MIDIRFAVDYTNSEEEAAVFLFIVLCKASGDEENYSICKMLLSAKLVLIDFS